MLLVLLLGLVHLVLLLGLVLLSRASVCGASLSCVALLSPAEAVVFLSFVCFAVVHLVSTGLLLISLAEEGMFSRSCGSLSFIWFHLVSTG